MRKKKLTKSEKRTLEKLNAVQVREMMNLKSRATVLLQATEEILSKIENSGINNHYSLHSDVARYANQVYLSSMRLGQLKALCDDLEYEYGYFSKKKSDKP